MSEVTESTAYNKDVSSFHLAVMFENDVKTNDVRNTTTEAKI
jgi:hypothetical protein